jgi:multimeric flavodoxin WrbA
MEMVRGARDGGARVNTLYLRHYDINSCVGLRAVPRPWLLRPLEDGMSLFYPEIEKCQGLILGSPVYNYNVSAQVKAFIDRLFPYYVFSNDSPRAFSSRLAGQDRRAVVYAVGEQKTVRDMALALPAMALPLEALGYDVAQRLIFRGF